MPLSDHEQRMLEEIERRLAKEDPKFVRGVSGATPYGFTIRKLKRAIAGFALGFLLLIVGLFTEALYTLGIVAFVVMLASLVIIATTLKQIGAQRSGGVDESWFGKLESRWRKRFDKDET
ncbi:MAG: DUF3040 domain-containing protein [Actinomycetota bacterium]